MAEIEHFCFADDKTHPKFDSVGGGTTDREVGGWLTGLVVQREDFWMLVGERLRRSTSGEGEPFGDCYAE